MAVFRRLGVFLLVAALALSIAPPRAQASDRDPWYTDVGGNWAEVYIRSLWEEGLTDGILERWFPWRLRAYFTPLAYSSRGEYAMLVAKTFGLPLNTAGSQLFVDVPPDFRLYRNKTAYPFLQAAGVAGIVQGDGSGRFYPNALIPREQAVAMLVRALDLGPLARSMPAGEVRQILGRYRDGLSVQPSLRSEFAAAVKLHIINGYPDGTLRPGTWLDHAQGVTILYRSAMIRAQALVNPFSPDGDGDQDLTTFALTSLKNGNARSWALAITLYDERNVVRTFSGTGPAPAALTWDGRDWAGRLLTPGTYYYRPYLVDRLGQKLTGVMKPVTLEFRSLSAYLDPSLAAPGSRFTVTALTGGRAGEVTAHLGSPASPGVPLRPNEPTDHDTNRWVGVMSVPLGQRNGLVPVYVEARFGLSRRMAVVSLLVYAPTWLRASVAPDTVRAGQYVTFRADTSPGMTSVTAVWPVGGTVPLLPVGPQVWKAEWRVPASTTPGTYTVPVRGWDRGRMVSGTVTLRVNQPDVEVQVYLSD